MTLQVTLSACQEERIRLDEQDEQYTETERHRLDPVAFSRECFGVNPWSKQRIFLRALLEYHKLCWRSGHKVSKSNTAALIAYWWACCIPNGRVVCTASTGRQVKHILWKEIRAYRARAAKIGKLILPAVPLDPSTGIQWDDGRYIVGFSTDDAVNMGGFSGPAMLFLVDEASGVAEQIFEAIEGNLAGGEEDDPGAIAKVVLFGNPTNTSGQFFDAFHKQRAFWSLHHVPSWESPNVTGETRIPGLATRHYVEQAKKKWGESDPRYQVRVAGNFPTQSATAVIKLGQVERGLERWPDTEESGRLHIGVDVARFGDDLSVAYPRRGKKALEPDVVNGFDEVEVSGMVLAMAHRLHIKGEPIPLVKVDVIGVGGGVASILRDAKDKHGDPLVQVVEVNVAEVAIDEDLYDSKRSELWFAIGEWLDDGGALHPDDDDVQGELIAPSYTFDKRGRQVVESKKDFKKRLGRSPDRADGLGLSIYTPISTEGVGITLPKVVRPGVGYRWGGGRGF